MKTSNRFVKKFANKSNQDLSDIVLCDGFTNEAKLAAIFVLNSRNELNSDHFNIKNKIEKDSDSKTKEYRDRSNKFKLDKKNIYLTPFFAFPLIGLIYLIYLLNRHNYSGKIVTGIALFFYIALITFLLYSVIPELDHYLQRLCWFAFHCLYAICSIEVLFYFFIKPLKTENLIDN